MSASGKHRLNNFDWYDAFGCYFDKDGGIDGFYNFDEVKEPFSHDWQDENGKQYDLTVIYFQDTQLTITGTMVAKTVADLNAKRDTLKAILYASGEKTWYVAELGRNFQFFYRKMTFTRITRVDDTVGRIGFKFQLTIQLLSMDSDNVPSYPNDFMLTKTVGTYAAMIAAGTPPIATQYKVLNDEHEGLTNTIYQKWPDGAIVFLPSATSPQQYFQQATFASHAAMVTQATGSRNKIFFVQADEVNPDDYGQLNRPAYYTYINGVLNKTSQRKDV